MMKSILKGSRLDSMLRVELGWRSAGKQIASPGSSRSGEWGLLLDRLRECISSALGGESFAPMSAIAERLFGGQPAAAKADFGAARQAVFRPGGVMNRKLALNDDGPVVEDRYFGSSHGGEMVAQARWIPGSAKWAVCALLVLACGAAAQEARSLLDALRAGGPDMLVRSADYACQMELHRVQKKPSQGIEIEEVALLEVAWAGGKERYSWPGEAAFREDELRDILVAGLSGSGSFAGHLRAVVFGRSTEFGEARAATDGRVAVVIPYRVPAANSGYLVTVDGREFEAAIAGEITLATGNGKPVLAAFTLRAVDLPEAFPARAVHEEVVFVQGLASGDGGADSHRVSAHSLAGVPVLARQTMTERSGDEYRNRVVYGRCREFRGETSIRFEEDPGERRTATASGERLTVSTRPVPRGVPIDVELETSLDWGKHRTGDTVEALVTRDARFKGSTVVPEGARLRGRIVELKKVTGKSEGYLVGMVLEEAIAGKTRIPLRMVLESLPGMPKGARRGIAAMVHGENARFRLMERTAPGGGPMPQGGFFQALGPELDVPKGFEMRWVTVDPDR